MRTQYFRVEGGQSLKGDLKPQGAKNEALQIICATLLTDQKVTVSNMPDIVDIRRLIELIRGLGVEVVKENSHSWQFQAKEIDIAYTATEEFYINATKIRGSVMLIAPMLVRLGKAYLPKPGGDKIGRRRLDTHLLALERLGAEFSYVRGKGAFELDGSGMEGQYILMEEISVTGTANLIMAAVLTRGKTTIYNAACEPYIQQLCRMLKRMGANIEGVGSNLLKIEGVEQLGGTTHSILPDMIEIGSFIGMAAITQSDIHIRNAHISELGNTLNLFRKLGVRIDEDGDDLHIPPQDKYEIQTFIDGSTLSLYDSPWPGYSPDLMSIALVVATQAGGSLLIHQKMFESRLFFVDKLIEMGARIILCDPHRAVIIGLNQRKSLMGIEMSSPDIRAGVALLIAAMSADGESVIHNINQIDRGYEAIEERLNPLGARIERIVVE